ncbi:MAG: hypothetical protein QN183_12110 [Armatimonadota bacterium]|nr:hypothetical protein [Armatimonadota bacterium]MDR7532758.1 hypothetical protein [Armatimonadota bacterium]MDR7537094.1 hypothetical protein [Armatimonadota bacterium]
MSSSLRPAAGRGFSTAEVLAAVILSGVVVGAAAGGAAVLASRRLAGAARVVAADLRVLGHRASAERTCYRVVFEPARETYTIARFAGAVANGSPHCSGGPWEGPLFAEAAAGGASRRLPAGVDLRDTSFPSETVTFSPLGNPTAGTVVLGAMLGRERRVTVEVTGYVRLSGP